MSASLLIENSRTTAALPRHLLRDQVAIVTGASRGIGAATAIALANQGVKRLLLHYNSYKAGIDNVLAAARSSGAQAEAIQADLGADPGIQAFLEALRSAGAAIDILVNNAGSLVKRAKLADFTPGTDSALCCTSPGSDWIRSGN